MLAQSIISTKPIDTSAYSNLYNQALPNDNNFQEQSVYCSTNKTIDELITEFGNKIVQSNVASTTNVATVTPVDKSGKEEKGSEDEIYSSIHSINVHPSSSTNKKNSNSKSKEGSGGGSGDTIVDRALNVKKIANNSNPFHLEGHEESPLEKQYNEMVLNKLDLMKDDNVDDINNINKANLHPSIQHVHVFATNEMSSDSRPSSAESSKSIGHVKKLISENICPECQEQLLKIYKHCLDHKEYFYPAINSCNEDKLGKYQTCPPFFDYYDKRANPFTQAELRVWAKEDGQKSHHLHSSNSHSVVPYTTTPSSQNLGYDKNTLKQVINGPASSIANPIPTSISSVNLTNPEVIGNDMNDSSNNNNNNSQQPQPQQLLQPLTSVSISNRNFAPGAEHKNNRTSQSSSVALTATADAKKTKKKVKTLTVEEAIENLSNEILKETIKEGQILKEKNQLYTLDLPNCPYYNDSVHRAIREKRQREDDNEKMENEGGYRNGIIGELGLNGFKHGGVFSGALAKSYIALKRKENSMIKDQYYELKKGYKDEIITSGALESALKKSMKYYIFAEEWQELQSERLKDYIRLLKIELSSLLAFLINSESKLSKTTYILESEKEKARERDSQIFQLQNELISVKEKLKNTYKECLDLNSTVCILQDEAKNGTKILQEKNNILRNSMKKLSKNYALCDNLLKSKIATIQDLEFELSQFIIQCNDLNDEITRWKKAKCESDSEVVALKNNLDILQDRYDKQLLRYDYLSKQKDEVIDQLAHEKQDHSEDNERHLAEIKDLRNDIQEKQTMIKRIILEKDQDRSELQRIVLAKNRLEESLNTLRDKYDKEKETFENNVKRYKAEVASNREMLNNYSQKVEKLEEQAAVLEAQHAKDIVACAKMNIDYNNARKMVSDIKKTFNDYVKKTNKIKAGEVKEKKQLLEMIKILKDKVQKKNEESVQLKMKNNEHEQIVKNMINHYEKIIKEKEQQFIEKEKEIQLEKQKFEEIVEKAVVEHIQSNPEEAYPEDYNEVKEHNAVLENLIKQNEQQLEEYNNIIEGLKQEKQEGQKKYDFLNAKINDVLDELTKLKDEHNTYVKEKHDEILRYTTTIKDMEEKTEFYKTDYVKKVKENDWLIKNLKFTKDILAQEITIKENMKSRYIELDEILKRERLENIENNTVKRRSNRIYNDVKYSYAQRMDERNKRLEYITNYLQREKERLVTIINFLPESLKQIQKETRKELKKLM